MVSSHAQDCLRPGGDMAGEGSFKEERERKRGTHPAFAMGDTHVTNRLSTRDQMPHQESHENISRPGTLWSKSTCPDRPPKQCLKPLSLLSSGVSCLCCRMVNDL